MITIDPVLPAHEILFFAPGRINGQSHGFSVLGFTNPPLAGLVMMRRRKKTP